MSYTFLKRNVFNFDLKGLTSVQARISKGSLFHRNPDYTEKKKTLSNQRREHGVDACNLGVGQIGRRRALSSLRSGVSLGGVHSIWARKIDRRKATNCSHRTSDSTNCYCSSLLQESVVVGAVSDSGIIGKYSIWGLLKIKIWSE